MTAQTVESMEAAALKQPHKSSQQTLALVQLRVGHDPILGTFWYTLQEIADGVPVGLPASITREKAKRVLAGTEPTDG